MKAESSKAWKWNAIRENEAFVLLKSLVTQKWQSLTAKLRFFFRKTEVIMYVLLLMSKFWQKSNVNSSTEKILNLIP